MSRTATTSHHLVLQGALTATLASAATAGAVVVLGRASSTAQTHAVLVLAATGIGLLATWYGLRTSPTLRAWSTGGIVATLAVAVAIGGLRSQPMTVNEQVVMAGPVETASGDAMMAKEDPPKRDVMMAKEDPPKGDAMMAKDAAPAPAPAPAATAAGGGGGDVMVKDEAPAAAQNALLSSGPFQPLEHAGRGTASIIGTADGRNILTLTGGFETDAGPDLVVWLVKGNPKNDTDVENGEHISLGALKGTSGDQQYVLPNDVDPSEFTHAYIWCRAFSVGFTRAQLA